MMRKRQQDELGRRLALPLRLSRGAMALERAALAFWSFAAAVMALLALLLSGLLALWPLWLGRGVLLTLAIAALASLIRGLRAYRHPGRAEALARLDESLPGNPIAALTDRQAIGAEDPASRAVWAAHRARMLTRLEALRVSPPAPGLAVRDPFALRLIAATALAVALLFGAGLEPRDLAALAPGGGGALAEASWEGWIEPPSYTGKPTLYLADQPPGRIELPVGSRVTLRLYGRLGAIRVEESFSHAPPEADEPTRSFTITGDGTLRIGDESWEIAAIPDRAPRIQPSGDLVRTLAGEMRLPFAATDDYGIAAGQARISLDLPRVSRRYGLAAEPDPREEIIVDLPLPYRGDRREIAELLVENLSEHAWAGLPVTITLTARDAGGQTGHSAPAEIVLPGRRFLDPLAQAIVEQRRDILWALANAPRAARILRAISNRPAGLFARDGQYLALRAAARGLEAEALTPEARNEVALALWGLALEIEDGALADALERLRQARERLSEAMRQGATPGELLELMQDYRQAMRDYLRELSPEGPRDGTDQPDSGQNLEMSQQDLQAMMDRIEELMQQGRIDEAQELLDMLQQMMENAQVTAAGPGGQGGQSPGQQALDGLAQTLRDQQGLSDEAFRNLQREAAPDAPAGESGQRPGLGQAESGAGEDGDEGEGAGQGEESDLAERQRALEEDLARQRAGLPGLGTEEGEAAREALDQAGRAMGEAADALESGDLSGALDRQAEAMENLREGMRDLQGAMRREAQAGQQGRVAGEPGPRSEADPLGRNPGTGGATGSDSPLEDREDVYRRAQELMDELRRRSGEPGRSDLERDYLRRLLDLF